jgi:hypothetical protein
MENQTTSGTEKRGPGRPPREKPLDKILAPEPEVAKESIVMPGNLTPEEQSIFSRVAQESEEWKTISEEESTDYSLQKDLFELPPPALKLEKNKEFAFRWITRKSSRMDEIKSKPIPFRWWPVNLNQPVGMVFKPFIDPNNGCVSREDQMLVFKPWWMFEKERAYKQKLADASDRSKSIESKDGQSKDNVEFVAGRRKDGKPMRQEVQGSDIQFKGEEEVDAMTGRSYPMASESDLTVDA